MSGKSKLIYIVGSVIIGITALLIILLGLVAGGVITVTETRIVISSASQEFVYDGKPHNNPGWKIEQGGLKKGHAAEVTVSGSLTNAGSTENKISAVIVDENGADVSDKYAIEYQTGTLTVRPRVISVTTSSASKEYDGTPLTANLASDHKITDGELVEGDEITAVNTSSIVDAGVTYNTFSRVYVHDAKGRDKTGNYEVICVPGTLEVKPRRISVEALSSSKVYDGLPLVCDNLRITSGTKLIAGHEITAWDIPSQATDAGSWENYIADLTVTDADGRDVTGNYLLDLHSGKLIITPRPLTVRSGSKSAVYTGQKLTCGDYEIVSATQPVEGHGVHVVVSGERTEVGESPNTIAEVIVTDKDGVNVTSNYSVIAELGVLYVKGADNPPPGGGDLDDSGNIGGGDSDADPQLALRVKSAIDDSVYLKSKSFGNYNGKSWSSAAEYGHLLNEAYGADYLTGAALKNAGYKSNLISVDVAGRYFLPYYMEMSSSDYVVQTSDVFYVGDGKSPYTLYYYSYNYAEDGAVNANLGEYSQYERGYLEYVNNNYLDYPQTTRERLSEIIDMFDPSDPDVIKKVASFVRQSAKYNLKYDKTLDSCEDIVVSFLTDYREGICQHYASAATLIYRMLGIPARYTIGFVGDCKAGEWSDITTENAHAWVEVYIEGTGWVYVEVTGGGPGGSGENGGEEDIDGGAVIKPVTEYYEYDGITAYRHSGAIRGFTEFAKQGYTYKCTVSADTRTSPGRTEIKFTDFRLYDPAGADVTDSVEYKLGTGYLCVYIWSIDVTTASAEKEYDGIKLDSPSEPLIEFSGTPPAGHEVRYTSEASLTDAGIKVNSCVITIFDGNGADVTDQYKINTHYGNLTVTHRKITVTADSAEKKFDGSPLKAEGCSVTEGSLAEGHEMVAEIVGSQTKPGRSDNKITSLFIVDENGVDVTKNYAVTTVNGILKVTP